MYVRRVHARLDAVKAEGYMRNERRSRKGKEAGKTRVGEKSRAGGNGVATVGDTARGSTIDHQGHLRCKT